MSQFRLRLSANSARVRESGSGHDAHALAYRLRPTW